MTLTDFGCSCDECPVPVVAPRTIPDVEAAYISFTNKDKLRGGRYPATARLFWDREGVPIMREMGWEFGLRQIGPVLARWS